MMRVSVFTTPVPQSFSLFRLWKKEQNVGFLLKTLSWHIEVILKRGNMKGSCQMKTRLKTILVCLRIMEIRMLVNGARMPVAVGRT